MGLFTKRAKPAEPGITIHGYLGDDAGTRLVDRLMARDWDSVRGALSQPDSPEQLGLLLVTAADTAGVEKWIDGVIADDPGSTLPLLVKGARYIHWAWEARGTGWSNTVTDEAWKLWFARLKVAEDCLDEVVEREPDNIEAWHFLITLARARKVSKEERWRRFNALAALDPHHYYGNSEMLEALKRKWSGSDEEMFEFARDRANAGPGTILPLLIVEAHMEYRRDHGGTEYLERKEVGDEFVTAAHQSLWHPDYRPNLQTRLLLNHFAHAFAMADRFVEAETCFAAIGEHQATFGPWGWGGEPAATSFLRLRAYVRNHLSS